jgi:hypothetical protein
MYLGTAFLVYQNRTQSRLSESIAARSISHVAATPFPLQDYRLTAQNKARAPVPELFATLYPLNTGSFVMMQDLRLPTLAKSKYSNSPNPLPDRKFEWIELGNKDAIVSYCIKMVYSQAVLKLGFNNSLSLNFGWCDPMADTNPRPDRTLNLTDEELQIIGYFVQGQKHSISSQNLKLEYTDTSIRLSDRNGRLLGISKQVSQWQRKVLITNNSDYRESVIKALKEIGFITRQKSSHPEFTEHHFYQVPECYKLNYNETIELWKVWWNHKRYQLNLPKPPIDVLTFTKGNWYPIRDLQPKQGNFIIRTERGEITVEPDEYIVWIDPLALTDARSPESQSVIQPPSSIGVPSKPNSIAAPIETTPNKDSEQPEEIDLEAYLNTFNTEDSEDIDRIEGIYNIGELLSGSQIFENVLPVTPAPKPAELPPPAPVTIEPPIVAAPVEPVASPEPPVSSPTAPTPSLSISQRQAALKDKAMQVLATYLQDGDLITQTEVLINAQGQELNRKIVKIQRGCPSWAIEQIGRLQ